MSLLWPDMHHVPRNMPGLNAEDVNLTKKEEKKISRLPEQQMCSYFPRRHRWRRQLLPVTLVLLASFSLSLSLWLWLLLARSLVHHHHHHQHHHLPLDEQLFKSFRILRNQRLVGPQLSQTLTRTV